MVWCEFTIRFVTPAFLDDPPARSGGLPPMGAQYVPFPVASLRGALRYWLRALVGAHLGNNLAQLAAVEAAVFGAAAGREGAPSPVLLRARSRIPLTNRRPDWLQSSTGQRETPRDRVNLQYLLGLGLWDKGQLSRRYTPEGTTVDLAVKNCGTPACAQLFLASLWALRTYGGLGARTRRGLGTIEVATPPQLTGDFTTDWQTSGIDDLHSVIEQVGTAVRALCPEASGVSGLPLYPAFVDGHFDHSDDQLDGAQNVGDALSTAGHELRQHRLDGDQRTQEYTSVVAPYLNDGQATAAPFGIGAFGLPVNFSDPWGPELGGSDRAGKPKRGRRSAIVEPVRAGTGVRRASPLSLRVYTTGSSWRLRSLALIAEWLPADATLRIEEKTGARGTAYRRQRPGPVTKPSQADIGRELRGWFEGRRPDPV